MQDHNFMRDDWDRRARENAHWHVASDARDDEAFAASGAHDVEFAVTGLDPEWLKTAQVLEIGCGAGRMTEFLLPRVGSLCAIDVSTEMIKRAEARLGSHPNLRLMATNGSDLSAFQDESFDLVLSYAVFQHIPKSIVRQNFKEIARVLRPGGVFRGQLAHITDPQFVPPPDQDTFSLRSWSPEEVRAELRRWRSLRVKLSPASATTDHIWVTARPPGVRKLADHEQLLQYARHQVWLLDNTLTGDEFYRQRLRSKELPYRPKISILTPVYNTSPDVLADTIASVKNQTYPNWELCLVNDASTENSVAEILDRCATEDSRMRVQHRQHNGGIVAASNDAFAMATGDFVALLDHDDVLEPDALYEVARLLNVHPEADLMYTDEDVLGINSFRELPFLKPDWSPEYILSCMYIGHLCVYRRELLGELGGFRAGLDGSQDYDLALRTMETTSSIFHIPRVLYHWRKSAESAVMNPQAKKLSQVVVRRW